ncbi:hypothetical protein [Blastococcus litoris]|uniref:hypothetical protein n=1 Tax=Blastococcus litoris TaxID=2171622 RepID=UPI000E2FFD23|nr:hypothetical protein [Blastococcus litoris]
MTTLLGEALKSGATWWLVVVGALAYVVLRSLLRWWRERSALRLAPKVYESGGDAADVLRALSGKSAEE